jgi:pilus assembly protein CpaC
MRMTYRAMAVALLLTVVGALASGPTGLAQGRAADRSDEILQQSVLRIPANGNFPILKRATLGRGKSLLVQFPFELKDVLVSDPEKVDAVVQSSNRVFLIGKGQGETNAFFFDTKGQQILLLEVTVGADLQGLDDILKRFVPGSSIRVEMAGRAAILSGSVRTPIDGKRAADIACQFVAANKSVGSPASTTSTSATSGTSQYSSTTVMTGTRTDSQYQSQTQQQAAACGSDTKLVINLLTVEGEEQVMLRVTVAEVQRTLLKQFGINIGAAINSGNFSTKLLTENAFPLTAAAGLGSLPIPGVGNGPVDPTVGPTCLTGGTLCNYNAGPAPGAFGNSGVTNKFAAGNTQLTNALRALERDGLIRTLAEPNMTAISGETANFLAGGEYPIPVVDSQGQLSVQYKKFGVGLAFTPVVLSEGRISLKIETEVSELTTEGAVVLSNISIPALKTRQAKTTVEMPSGGSLAIAGLISDSTKQNVDGFPGLKDMPMLGTLFRSRDFIKSETELVVIVTPYMVRPTARQNLARADDGLAPASDLKANFLGHLNRIYGKTAAPPPGGLKGDYGFIVE